MPYIIHCGNYVACWFCAVVEAVDNVVVVVVDDIDVATFVFLLSWDQLYEWLNRSVRLLHLLNYVPIIVSSWNFQELLPLTEVMSIQKVKVTEFKTQLSGLWTVTPIWIHIWW